MQEISLENLKKLLPGPRMDESLFDSARTEDIGGGLRFKDICDAYDRQMDRLEREHGEYGVDSLRPQAYEYINGRLAGYCPPIVLAGKGSSRAAYACVGGKCVKVAVNAAGVAQNRQELKHTKKSWLKRRYGCFVRTYGSNGSDCGVILSECCAPCESPGQLAQAFGLSGVDAFKTAVIEVAKAEKHDVRAAAADLRKQDKSDGSAGRAYRYFSRKWDDPADEARGFLAGLASQDLSEMTPGERSLLELFEFWRRNGVRELLPGDVQRYQNWGFAIRDGRIAPVMLDVGFSHGVSRRYYR